MARSRCSHWRSARSGRRTPLLLGFGIAGAALFYGDAAITPAISVLSAVEGLKLVTPVLDPYVLPITLGILFALFWVQSRGTERVSAYFGPITLVWFIVLAALGLLHAFDRPVIFRAIDPSMAVRFFVEHGFGSLWVMGSVFLAVTGAEALYADMGHFGRGPIRLAWSAVVFPALALNYFGQGSLVLAHPEAAENSFFLLAPEWALLPLVLMATVATVIASQAVITGAYSLTQQAVQLGLLPRFAIRHTSESLVGQIYMPRVNWLLLAAVVDAGAALRQFSRAGERLRDRRHRRDGCRFPARLHRVPSRLALAAGAGSRRPGAAGWRSRSASSARTCSSSSTAAMSRCSSPSRSLSQWQPGSAARRSSTRRRTPAAPRCHR